MTNLALTTKVSIQEIATQQDNPKTHKINLQKLINSLNTEIEIFNNRIVEYNELSLSHPYKAITLLEICDLHRNIAQNFHSLLYLKSYRQVINEQWFRNTSAEFANLLTLTLPEQILENIKRTMLELSVRYNLSLCQNLSLGANDIYMQNFLAQHFQLLSTTISIEELHDLNTKLDFINKNTSEELKYIIGKTNFHPQIFSKFYQHDKLKTHIIKNTLLLIPVEERIDIFSDKKDEDVSIEVKQARMIICEEDYEFGKVMLSLR